MKEYRFLPSGTARIVLIGARNDAEALSQVDCPGRMEVWNGFIWVGLGSPLRAGLV